MSTVLSESQGSPSPANGFRPSAVFTVIVLAVLIRTAFLLHFDVVTPDGVVLMEMARTFEDRTFFTINDPEHHHQPLYPALVSLLSLLVPDHVRSGQIISLAASIAAVVLVFRLASQAYGLQAGFYSALAFSLTPLYALYSVMVLKESLYVLLALAVIFYCFKGLTSHKAAYFAMTGLFLGASYLARVDGILLLLVIPFLYYASDNKALARGRVLLAAAIASAVYLAFVAVLFVQTGAVTFSKKLDYYVNPLQATDAAKTKLVRDYGPERAEEIIRINSQWKGYLEKRAEGFYKNIHHVLPSVFPPLFLLLAGIGLAKSGFGRQEALVLLVPAIYLFLFPFIKYPDDNRYILSATPFLSIFAGKGVSFLQERISLGNKSMLMVSTSVFLVIFVPWTFSPFFGNKAFTDVLLYKESGLVIKNENKKEGTLRVLSPSPVVSFYAGSAHIPLDGFRSAGGLAGQLMEEDIDFAVINEDASRALSAAADVRGFGLREIHRFTDSSNQKMGVFRIIRSR